MHNSMRMNLSKFISKKIYTIKIKQAFFSSLFKFWHCKKQASYKYVLNYIYFFLTPVLVAIFDLNYSCHCCLRSHTTKFYFNLICFAKSKIYRLIIQIWRLGTSSSSQCWKNDLSQFWWKKKLYLERFERTSSCCHLWVPLRKFQDNITDMTNPFFQ